MAGKLEFYEHSGALPPLGLLIAVGGGLLGASILGWLYAEFIIRIPIIYINFVASLAFGYATGAVVSRLSKAGKIRQPALPGTLAVAAALWGIYVSWGRDLALRGLVPEEMVSFTLSPGTIWAYVSYFNEVGAWTVGDEGGPPVSGGVLWIVWFVEACLICGAAWMGSRDALEGALFCERCGDWTHVEHEVKRLSKEAFGTLKKDLREGRLELLAEARVVDPGGRTCVRLDLATCPTCTGSNYVTLVEVSVSRSDSGVEHQHERQLVAPIRVPPEVAAGFPGVKPAWVASGLRPPPPRASSQSERRAEPTPAARTSAPERRRESERGDSSRSAAASAGPAREGSIRMVCPKCGAKSKVAAKHAGRWGRCAKCKENVQVPHA